MTRLKARGQVLAAEQGEVVFDREHLCLGVEVTLGRELNASCGDPGGSILDALELGDVAGGDEREPDWGSVCEEGSDGGFVGGYEGLLLPTPRGTRLG